MSQADRLAIAASTPATELMENAGKAVACEGRGNCGCRSPQGIADRYRRCSERLDVAPPLHSAVAMTVEYTFSYQDTWKVEP